MINSHEELRGAQRQIQELQEILDLNKINWRGINEILMKLKLRPAKAKEPTPLLAA